jgi:hypothetical protein
MYIWAKQPVWASKLNAREKANNKKEKEERLAEQRKETVLISSQNFNAFI